jgi:hypothetical protein
MDGTQGEYLAIDADGHVIESDDLFFEYLEPNCRDRTGGQTTDRRGRAFG